MPPYFERHLKNVASLTPCLRHSSAALKPAWCSLKMPMIRSSLTLDRFIVCLICQRTDYLKAGTFQGAEHCRS